MESYNICTKQSLRTFPIRKFKKRDNKKNKEFRQPLFS